MRACLLVLSCATCLACAAAGTVDGGANAKTYTGAFSSQFVESIVSVSLMGGGTFPCTNNFTSSGTLTLTVEESTGAVTGSGSIEGTQTETGHGGGTSCVAKSNLPISWAPKISGTNADLRFAEQYTAVNGSYSVLNKTSFVGTLSGGVVTGTLSFSVAGSGTIGTTSITQTSSSTASVTLR